MCFRPLTGILILNDRSRMAVGGAIHRKFPSPYGDCDS